MAAELRLFPPFRLDSTNEQLWRGTGEIRLRPKTFAVLRHLVEHPGQLVTKAALLDAVWPKVSVSDSMPAISVRELRKALGDDADSPRFIETVQGRGYRFIAPVKLETEARLETKARLETAHAPAPPVARQSSFAIQTQKTSFVGRKEESSEVRDALEHATSGRGRICLISGEAGIGKSRLCAEISLEAETNGLAVLVGHCSEQDAIPYLPFVEILERWVDRFDSPDDLRRAIGDEGPELARLLPKLRRIIPDLPAPMELTGEQARRQLFNSFSNFIAQRSKEQPTMLVLEDLHWADDSTLALITHLSQRHSDLPLLIVATFRESDVDLSPSLSRTLEGLIRGRLATQLRLEGLPSSEVAQMLHGLSGQAPPDAVASAIHAETGGNPFFVEELFEHLSEENRLYDSAGQFRAELKIAETEVPRNVRLVVGRRLARLGDATRKTLATAAVIGRFFTFELLEAAASAHADAMLDSMDEARTAGVIRSSLVPSSAQYPQARFAFSHELIRQTIMSELSVARLQRLHLEVAETIERLYPNTLEDHHADLAYHYAQTANTSKAVTYLHLAGLQAAGRSAHAEAISLFNSSLELLRNLPETAERDKQELATQTALGTILIGTKGDGAPEVRAALSRAVDLSRKLGDNARLFAALFGLALFHLNQAQHPVAQGLAKDLLSLAKLNLAKSDNDPAPVLVGHSVLGQTSYWLGELAFAHENLAQAAALYDPEQHGRLAFAYGLDPAVSALGYDCYALWQMGYPDQALAKAKRGLAIAQKAGHPNSLAAAMNHLAIAYMLRRETELALESARAAIAMANKEGLPLWAAVGAVTMGATMVRTNQDEKGLAQLHRAGEAVAASGSRLSPVHVGSLAQAFSKTGRVEEGLSLVTMLLAAVHASSTFVDEPWLYHLKGEVLLDRNPPDEKEAESCFRTSIELAQRIGAKSTELRASTSLAHLLANHGNRTEARTLLTEIYNWFTEALNTPDLTDAKSLLEELTQ